MTTPVEVAEARAAAHRADTISDLLFWEGDDLMRKLGMKRDPEGRWSDEDLDWVFAIAMERGMNWLREEAAK